MNKQITYFASLQIISIFLLLVFNSFASASPGKIIGSFEDKITIEIGSSILYEKGDRIDITYMAGLLEMLIGRYEVITVEKDRLEVREISLAMQPSNNMKVIVTKSMKIDIEDPDPAAMLPSSEDPRFFPENMGGYKGDLEAEYKEAMFDGEVIEVMETDVRIKMTSSENIRVGDLVDLIYQTSSGAEIPVGSWSVTRVNEGKLIASALDKTTEPSVGMKAKITTSKKVETFETNNVTTPIKKDSHIFKSDRNNSTLETSAREGDPIAQNRLGWNYQKGIDVPRDYQKAIYWYRKAAEQGHPDGQSNMGWVYQNGLGLKKDLTQAFYWFQKAANQGYAIAQNNLGVMYNKGDGVKKDQAQAVYWFQKAASQGNTRAQNNIGWNYQKGVGVPHDYQKAVYWYRKAAEQGHLDGQNNMGWMYQNGFGVKKDLVKAVYWYNEAANQGYAPAQNNLGGMYHNGLGVKQDLSQALSWYQKAADQGNVRAQNNLKLFKK